MRSDHVKGLRLALGFGDAPVVALDVHEETHGGRCEHDKPKDEQDIVGLRWAKTEHEAPAHSADVAPVSGKHRVRSAWTGGRHSGHGASCGGLHVGYDSESAALRHLNTEQQDADSRAQRVHLGEDQEHDVLPDQSDRLRIDTPVHAGGARAEQLEQLHSASEEVHEAEQGGDETRLGDRQLVLGLQVRSEDVIHGELNAEAGRVLDEQNPGVVLGETLLERLLGRPAPLCVSSLKLPFGESSEKKYMPMPIPHVRTAGTMKERRQAFSSSKPVRNMFHSPTMSS